MREEDEKGQEPILRVKAGVLSPKPQKTADRYRERYGPSIPRWQDGGNTMLDVKLLSSVLNRLILRAPSFNVSTLRFSVRNPKLLPIDPPPFTSPPILPSSSRLPSHILLDLARVDLNLHRSPFTANPSMSADFFSTPFLFLGQRSGSLSLGAPSPFASVNMDT